ncbi:fungal-specific transcription factor domain-containing protein [Auriculariales sp. MPI-PUGE-AT-0066]|nr:fungal-specific transcription factor domain-containing protein [Auriculariales sp. MPI-PUGE-AT-0066]
MPLTSGKTREMSRRPCDRCRRGKRRCDGPEQEDRVCSRCKQMSEVCSYVDSTIQHRSARQDYIAALESRLRIVETLLQRHVPEALLMHELGSLAMTRCGSIVDSPILVAPSLPAPERWDYPIAQTLQNHGLNSPNTQAQSDTRYGRRPEFWCVPAHEFRLERPEGRYLDPVLPPPDRLASLIQAYFDTWNPLFPMFHRQLFEKQLVNAQFVHDKRFGVILLLVCALAETSDKDIEHRSRRPLGWNLFCQAEPFLRVPTPAEPQLSDVQMFLLAALYMGFVHGNSAASIFVGTAIRLAYLANSHRREKYNHQNPTLLDELWKRTFWSLVVNDRIAASIFGWPISMKDESFDLDLPLEVDDTCWDIEAPGFPLRVNPAIKRSELSFFVANIRLYLIFGVSLRTIYSNNRSRLLMGFVGSNWEQRIKTKIDDMLDEWLEALPIHLRWDPNSDDLTRFLESSFLSAKYYSLKIHAHNPFMRITARDLARAASSSRNAADLTYSLAICTTAAVDCSQVIITVMERHPRSFKLAGWAEPPWVCGLVLLVNLFGFRSSLSEDNIIRFTKYVQACLDALTIISVDDSVAVQRRESLYQLLSELQQEPSPSSHTQLTPLWPENRTIPLSPQSMWSPLASEQLPSGLGGDDPRLRLPQSSMRASDKAPLLAESPHSSFCLEAIPSGLRNQLSTNVQHPNTLLTSRDTTADHRDDDDIRH